MKGYLFKSYDYCASAENFHGVKKPHKESEAIICTNNFKSYLKCCVGFLKDLCVQARVYKNGYHCWLEGVAGVPRTEEGGHPE